jgi:hypothetical protein
MLPAACRRRHACLHAFMFRLDITLAHDCKYTRQHAVRTHASGPQHVMFGSGWAAVPAGPVRSGDRQTQARPLAAQKRCKRALTPQHAVHVVLGPEQAHLVGAIAQDRGRGAGPQAPQPLLPHDRRRAVHGALSVRKYPDECRGEYSLADSHSHMQVRLTTSPCIDAASTPNHATDAASAARGISRRSHAPCTGAPPCCCPAAAGAGS